MTARRLLLAYAAFVVYGSLVPLEGRPLPLADAWAAFQGAPFLQLGVESRADWIANGVLYLPLGLFAAQWLRPALGAAGAAVLAALGCWALALAVEFAQVFFPPRTVSRNDLLAEALGSTAGVLIAPLAAGWLHSGRRAWQTRGRAALLAYALPAYALAYVLLALFPYDVLLAADEWRAKLESPALGWLVAGDDPRKLAVALKLVAEVALALPLGVWLARRRRGVGLAAAVAAGAALGLALELAQLALASGVSQGASVLARAAGVGAGAMLARSAGVGWAAWRPRLRRGMPLLLPTWLALLAAANGLFGAWPSAAQAMSTWAELRLLPFYYHYYTTEAAALASLGFVALSYLPLAAFGWSGGWTTRRSVLAAAALASVVEFAKAWIPGLRPDPTNVLIAAAAVALGLAALDFAQRDAPDPPGAAVNPGRQPPPGLAHATRVMPAMGLLLAAALALRFPIAPAALAALVVAAGAASVRWPWLPLALLPAALPVLDLAPWSGRVGIDAFDLLSLACLAGAWLGTPRGDALRWPLVLLGSALVPSALRGLVPGLAAGGSELAGWHDPLNPLFLLKGAAWAAALLLLWQRLAPHGTRRVAALHTGFALGLAGTIAVVLWERAAFAGLTDFTSGYRATGLFSGMHKGGALIECWLAVAGAFVAAAAVSAKSWPARAAAALLLAGAGYAMLVTYSRNGYVALALAVCLAAWCAAPRWRWLAAAGGGVAVALAALAIVATPAARERLAGSVQDFGARQAHWQDGLRLAQPGVLDTLLGVGLGGFPQAHLWRSGEPARAATLGLGTDGQTTWLRVGAGGALYVEQVIVPRPPPGPLTLTLRARATAAMPLRVALCDKWTLASRSCAWASAPLDAGTGWQALTLVLDAAALDARMPRPPLKLSLLAPAGAAFDVTGLQLAGADGRGLLHNGSFAAGLDRWFFAVDSSLPWLLDSLPLTVWIEQGAVGALAWLLAVGWTLARGSQLAWLRRAEVPAALAAALAFLASGLLNTLIDEPRFLGLLLLLLGLAARGAPARGGAEAKTAP